MATQVETTITHDSSNLVALINNGFSLSQGLDLGTKRLSWIQIPATWTAANLTFQIGSGTTGNVTATDPLLNIVWANFFNGATEYTVTVNGASSTQLVTYSDFWGVRFLKIRSGTNSVPVLQPQNTRLVLGLTS